jgi:hypothetical protein
MNLSILCHFHRKKELGLVLKNFLTNSEILISPNFSLKSENFPDKFFGAATWQDFFRFFLRIFDRNTI